MKVSCTASGTRFSLLALHLFLIASARRVETLRTTFLHLGSIRFVRHLVPNRKCGRSALTVALREQSCLEFAPLGARSFVIAALRRGVRCLRMTCGLIIPGRCVSVKIFFAGVPKKSSVVSGSSRDTRQRENWSSATHAVVVVSFAETTVSTTLRRVNDECNGDFSTIESYH